MTATLGTMLDLKPILTVTREGKIVAFDKVKGRKKVVKYLADSVEKNDVDDDICKELMVVCHGDNQ
ncbi:MAG: DegV family protein [Christensenellaceae bacterium]